MEDEIHVIVRCKFELRNPKFGEDVVRKHIEILDQKGSVWWGIGTIPAPEKVKRLKGQIQAGIPTFVFIYETGTPPELAQTGRRWYRAELSCILSDLPADVECIPAHYQGDDKSRAFIRLTSIRPLPYVEAASPILPDRSPFRYALLSGPPRPEYLHQYSDPSKPVMSLPDDFSGPTVRELLYVDVQTATDSDFLEDISEDIRTSQNLETIERVIRVYRRNNYIVKTLKELYEGDCQFKGCTNMIVTTTGWYTEGHHRIPLGKGGSDHPTNLVILCPQHHKMLHHAKDRDKLTNSHHFWYHDQHESLF